MRSAVKRRARARRGTLQAVANVMGSLYLSVLFLGIINSRTVQPVASEERAVSYRERAAGARPAFQVRLRAVRFKAKWRALRGCIGARAAGSERVPCWWEAVTRAARLAQRLRSKAGRARAGMYGSLPFALAQCVVEVPYNLVQVRRAAGALRRAQTPCSCQAGVFVCLSRPRFPGRLQAPRIRC